MNEFILNQFSFIDEHEKQSWIMITFFRRNTLNIIAELSKIQVDIRDTETKALLHLFNQATQTEKDDILASISYAQRIQQAVLPPIQFLEEILPEHFVLYKPRDIVSGDFYWIKKVKNFVIVIASDCTGHGVPGAFMSMQGISFLNEIVTRSRFDSAGEILNRLRKKVKTSLRQTGEKGEQKDGMDVALCIIDLESKNLEFAGAYNPLYIICESELIQIKEVRQPVGIHLYEQDFTTQHLELSEGDALYLFSDGYVDQMGGELNKKFMSKNFKKLLLNIHLKSMKEQKEILENTINTWMKDQEQIDDILVSGFRI